MSQSKPVASADGTFVSVVRLRVAPPPVETTDDINAISYWLNGTRKDTTFVIPTYRNQPFFFNVAQTDLLDDVINVILYKLHRPSGNESPSVEL